MRYLCILVWEHQMMYHIVITLKREKEWKDKCYYWQPCSWLAWVLGRRKRSRISTLKSFRFMPLDSIIRRISLILVMIRVRMITSTCRQRDGMVWSIPINWKICLRPLLIWVQMCCLMWDVHSLVLPRLKMPMFWKILQLSLLWRLAICNSVTLRVLISVVLTVHYFIILHFSLSRM